MKDFLPGLKIWKLRFKKLSARVEKCETQETSLETSLEKASSPEKAFSPAQEFFKPSKTLDLYSLAPEILQSSLQADLFPTFDRRVQKFASLF